MCGIFGIVSDTRIKFNKGLFRALGIDNDSRGGDSCGIFIDGKVDYGINENKLFYDFYKQSELYNSTRECCCAIGHDRKASVGAISLDAAQPVVFKNSNGDIEFVVIHNGTIYNYLDLADKYIPDVDCSNMTDSQVMANIFYRAGYDCLSEYQGGAVFFIVDYRSGEPKYFGWKGVSKKTSYTSYKAGEIGEEERPFYFAQSGCVTAFSSIDTCLYVVSDTVYTLNDNSLIQFKNGKTYLIKEYDRSKVDQSGYQYDKGRKKTYFPTQAYGRSTVSPNTQNANSWYDDYDDYYGYNSWNDYYTNRQLTTREKGNEDPFHTLPTDSEKNDFINIQYDINHDIYINNNCLCHGKYEVSIYGYGSGYSGNKSNPIHYFFNGIHMLNKDAYEFVIELMNKHKINVAEVIKRYDNLIHYLSHEPYILNHVNGGKWVINNEYYTHNDFNGYVLKYFYTNKLHIDKSKYVYSENMGFPKVYTMKKSENNCVDINKLKTIYL